MGRRMGPFHPSVGGKWRKASCCRRFGSRAAVGVAAVCGLALMTVPVLAQFGQRGGGGCCDFFGPFSGQPRSMGRASARPISPRRRRRASSTTSRPPAWWCSATRWPTGWRYGLEDALGDNRTSRHPQEPRDSRA